MLTKLNEEIKNIKVLFLLQGFRVSISMGLVISTTLIVVLGNYWKRRKYSRESAPVIKHYSYDKRKANVDVPSGKLKCLLKQIITYYFYALCFSI